MWLTVTTLAAFAASVSAVGKSVVINHSLDTLYLWSVGDATGPEVTVAPNATWTEELHRGSKVPGVAIKICKVKDGLYSGAATQILGYTLDGARVWYSLDATNGEPFVGHKLTVTSNGGGSIEWPSGKDVGEETRDSANTEDVVLTIFPGT